jgi:N-acetyl sugar amidotransferase
MPETSEGIAFDELGICKACRSSEQKMHIDWAAREKELRRLLEHYKGISGDHYDCLVPISGGKDSTFQLHVLTKIYQMHPMAVTFNHNWYSEVGKYNLQNALEKFNVDHIMYTPNQSLVNRLAKQSLYAIGDSCWHCHAGVGAFPLHIAIKFGIKLIIWGESAAEVAGKTTYYEPIKFDVHYFNRISAKTKAEEIVNEEIAPRELAMFRFPSPEEYAAAGVEGIFLGDYMFWDGERQVEFIKKEYDWREGEVEGTYKKYKSVECIMPGVHDYLKFLKRGFGRGTDHASQDVRAGLLSREEGFELAKKYDQERPQAMDHYLEITGLTEEEVLRAIKAQRKGKAVDLP